MLYVFLALALLSGCALTYAASGFSSLAAVWQVPVFFLGSFLALVVLFLLVVLVSCLFVDPKKLLEKPSGYFRFLLNEFCRIALTLGGVHVNVTGLEQVPREGRFLLVSNHRFAFDPIVFYAVMPWADLAFLSKKENFSIFIVAQIMREVLCLPVDRDNDRESLKSILKAIQFIRDDKASIAVFPESGPASPIPQRRVQDRAEGECAHRGLFAGQFPRDPAQHVPQAHGSLAGRAGRRARGGAGRKDDDRGRRTRSRGHGGRDRLPREGAGAPRIKRSEFSFPLYIQRVFLYNMSRQF